MMRANFLVVVAAVTIATAEVALIVAQSATTQPAPGGSPYPPTACTIEPRTFEQYATLVANATPIPETFIFPTAVPSPGTFTFGMLIGDLPSGPPADPETVAAITDTMQQLIACHQAGDPYRMYSLFSDRLLRMLAGLPGSNLLGELATPYPLPENQHEYLAAVEAVQFLPDGRVSALVTRGNVDDPHPAPGRTQLIIFVYERGRWVVDDVYEEILPLQSGAEPTPVAELRPKSRQATPVAASPSR
ncbi:MAG: hypothetical protein KatS3mg059_0113 [Thermomicrobiales bacterium]|nr:MAG: hypothetical protein KatS3mg059_0113 [Thermomicrobiales bacterium]